MLVLLSFLVEKRHRCGKETGQSKINSHILTRKTKVMFVLLLFLKQNAKDMLN